MLMEDHIVDGNVTLAGVWSNQCLYNDSVRVNPVRNLDVPFLPDITLTSLMPGQNFASAI
jgi:hypothetical protein